MQIPTDISIRHTVILKKIFNTHFGSNKGTVSYGPVPGWAVGYYFSTPTADSRYASKEFTLLVADDLKSAHMYVGRVNSKETWSREVNKNPIKPTVSWCIGSLSMGRVKITEQK